MKKSLNFCYHLKKRGNIFCFFLLFLSLKSPNDISVMPQNGLRGKHLNINLLCYLQDYDFSSISIEHFLIEYIVNTIKQNQKVRRL